MAHMARRADSVRAGTSDVGTVPGRRPGSSKDRIVMAATELFLAAGYPATTVDEIGAAAGVTGPAIYRHYKSKAELLEAVVDRGAEPGWTATRQLMAEGGDPREMLLRLVAAWVELSVNTKAFIALYSHEHPYLDDATRRRIRARHRELTGIWVGLLGQVHPDRPRPELTAMVDSAFWLMRSPAFYQSELAPDRLSALLTSMMAGALAIR
jgi:AcrR family transcriptional regulator